MQQFDFLFNILLSACCLHLLWLRHRPKIKRWLKYNQDRLPRKWQPKSPHDCHACCQHLQLSSIAVNHAVEPYAKRKSTRGRHKSVASQGIACLNPSCDYFGIIDQYIHALVNHGKRGQHRAIHYIKCQVCNKAFSSRKGTPLYYPKHPSIRSTLCCGSSLKVLTAPCWFGTSATQIALLPAG